MPAKKYDGGPAFPGVWENDSDLNQTAPDGTVVSPLGVRHITGLSLRDYFAAKAMQGWIASSPTVAGRPFSSGDRDGMRTLAKAAYAVADAMLNARAKA